MTFTLFNPHVAFWHGDGALSRYTTLGSVDSLKLDGVLSICGRTYVSILRDRVRSTRR